MRSLIKRAAAMMMPSSVQGCGIELELAFEKTHELGIELELVFATNSPTETKFPSMSGILIEITASSCHLDNLITHY